MNLHKLKYYLRQITLLVEAEESARTASGPIKTSVSQREATKRYKAKNKAKVAEYQREYRRRKAAERAEYQRQYRARVKDSPPTQQRKYRI